MQLKYFLTISSLFTVLHINSVYAQQPAVKKNDYDKGEDLFWIKKYDSAFLLFNNYINNPDDINKKGYAYTYMGQILWINGDLYGAQEYLTNALHTFNPDSPGYVQAIGYVSNLFGNVSGDLKLYDEAIEYYNKTIAAFKGSEYSLEALNGKALVLQKTGNYAQAIAIYDSLLDSKPADQLLVARLIDNRAKTKWLADPGYQALPEFHTALKIRIDSQYTLGLNASYAHFADYYAKINPDSALWYAQKMLETAKQNRSPEDILEAIDKLIRLNRDPVVKTDLYKDYKTLNDSLHYSRDTTKRRFANIRYDIQKSKAENLLLQQHISNQRLLIFGLIATAILVITALTLWYNKRRKRIKQESANAIRDAQLKTSQKIHDVVANGLYGIMNELEHGKTLEREPLMTKIEGLYERSRNISYENYADAETTDYDRQIHQLLNAFSNEERTVIVVGNQPQYWNKVSARQKKELELILSELMINMKKHSGAAKVAVVFKQEKGVGYITYTDDGVGFPANTEHGNGLKNTVSRIKSINGEITFDKRQERGVSIVLSFPLE